MHNLSEAERRAIFFYAQEDAQNYDTAEELTQPHIDIIHDTMVKLLDYSLRGTAKDLGAQPLNILDVASGTGAEGLRILSRFPTAHLVAVDFSSPMNEQFRQKFSLRFPGIDFASKVRLLNADFFGTQCEPSSLIEQISARSSDKRFHAVVAGFFLHHYPEDLKREFYERTFRCLRPNGVLVHADLFSFQSQELSEYAHRFGEAWIVKQFTQPEEHLRPNLEALGDGAGGLLSRWVDHWNNRHDYNPLEPASSVPQDAYRDLKSLSHIEMIRDAGFREVECPFRLWEAGIVWARA